MRFATIDLGTNSVRFDVHEVNQDGDVAQLHREKLMIRLGQDVFVTGRLSKDAIQRTLRAFQSFKQTATQLHVQKIVAYATSALREASDRSRLIREVENRTGIGIRVISGDEEARLIAQGILHNEKLPHKGPLALVDIGGGSAEVSICKGKKIVHAKSFDLGVARLQQVFLKKTPPGASAIRDLRIYIKKSLLPVLSLEKWPEVRRIVGSSGTIRALLRLHQKRNQKDSRKPPSPLSLSALRRLIREMEGLGSSELQALPGMEPKRVDLILGGAILLEEIMTAIGAEEVVTSEYSLRDGILGEEIRLIRTAGEGPLRSALHLADFASKAKKLGAHEGHFKKVAEFSGILFDSLKRVHGLKNSWKDYLTAAAIFHDVGETVNRVNHAEHTLYILRNSDLRIESWEAEWIGHLCRLHAGGKYRPSELSFKGRERREAFGKLLALLRIADALDRSHRALVKLDRVIVRKDEVILEVSAGPAADLDLLRVEQKKELFEKLLKKRLTTIRKRS